MEGSDCGVIWGVLFRHLSGTTEEDHEATQSRQDQLLPHPFYVSNLFFFSSTVV